MMAVAIKGTSASCTSGAKAIVGVCGGSIPRSNSICFTLTSRCRVHACFGQASVTRPQEVVLQEDGDRPERANTDDGLRAELDRGGRRRDHPDRNHKRHARWIPNGHGLAPVSKAENLQFLAMQRMERIVNGDGRTYGVMTGPC